MKTMTADKMTATQAREMAKNINLMCSDCFDDAKAVKQMGRWVIKIGGGREACYGRAIESVEGAKETIRIFRNDA